MLRTMTCSSLLLMGARVLHSRAVEIAKKYNVKIYCASSFTDEEGTWVVERLLSGLKNL